MKTDTPAVPLPTTVRVLRRETVLDRVGVSYPTLWRWMGAGRFPKPIKLSVNSVGWLEADVEAWIRARLTVSADHHNLQPCPQPKARAKREAAAGTTAA